jgi:DNA-binding NtrC family response regulator
VVDDREELPRWFDALRRLRVALPWARAVLIAGTAWETGTSATELHPARADDPALRLAERVTTDSHCWFESTAEAALPESVSGALVVRRAPVTMVFEFARGQRPPAPMAQELAFRVLRLLGALGCFTGRRPAAPSHGLVGESPVMLAVFDLMRRQADSQAAVHIYGETGTGKERVARAIHAGSPRAHGPFVPVNASSIADELFESEFFGHVRGSFTGAVSDREGYVAQAQGGTLFLDEVADLSRRAQTKLLRFLEDGEYRRVGDPRLRRADVRVVTATNTPLHTRVAEGLFRDDLLFRIRTLSLSLPPLREREGDVQRLGQHFLREIAALEKKPQPRIGESAWRLLEGHAWRGNVRQLRAEMYRLVVEHPGALVRPQDLSPEIRESRATTAGSLDAATRQFARDRIQKALSESRGVKAAAARRLGMSRQGLRAKMQRLGMS